MIDQANALDDGEYDRVSNEKKMQTHRLLNGLSSKYMKLEGFTANYSAAKYDHVWATSGSRINLYMVLVGVSFPTLNMTSNISPDNAIG